MAEAADQAQHDFWRPPMPMSEAVAHRGSSDERSATCHRCATEFIVSSLYCHACGASRPGLNAARPLEIRGLAELVSLGERLGLTTPALIAFLVGALCVVGALAVSVLFSVRTALDWQAIQLWRVEWLLAAIASFVAGCLLKK
jgi:spore maturation protein SpmA